MQASSLLCRCDRAAIRLDARQFAGGLPGRRPSLPRCASSPDPFAAFALLLALAGVAKAWRPLPTVAGAAFGRLPSGAAVRLLGVAEAMLAVVALASPAVRSPAALVALSYATFAGFRGLRAAPRRQHQLLRLLRHAGYAAHRRPHRRQCCRRDSRGVAAASGPPARRLASSRTHRPPGSRSRAGRRHHRPRLPRARRVAAARRRADPSRRGHVRHSMSCLVTASSTRRPGCSPAAPPGGASWPARPSWVRRWSSRPSVTCSSRSAHTPRSAARRPPRRGLHRVLLHDLPR